MILSDFKSFPRAGKLVGVDWGQKRIGVAISDESQDFVFAREQLESAKCNAQRAILDLINLEKVKGLVIGLPLYSDGTDSKTTGLVRKFADELSKSTDIPIIFMNESLTSVEADEILGNTNMRKRKLNKSKLDSVAAGVILENAIAAIRRA